MILIVIIGGGIYFYTKKGEATVEYVTAKAVMGEVKSMVSVTGTVVSANEVELSFKYPSEVKEIPVKVSDVVTKGQDLVLSVATDFENQVAQAESALAAEEAMLDQMKAGAGSEEVQVADVAVKNAERSLSAAEKRLASLQATTTQDLASALLQVTNAQTNLDSAKRSLEDTKASNSQNITNANTQISNAEKDSSNAQISLNDTIATNDQSIKSAETELDNAEAYLDSANSYYDGVKRDYDRDLASRAQLESAELTVTQAENSKSTAEENLRTVQARATASKNTAQANLDAAKYRLDNARDSLQSITLTARMQENNAQSAVSTAEVSLMIAEQAQKSIKTQVDGQIENSVSDVESARGSLDAAKANLELVKSSARDVDMKPQEARVAQAKSALELAKKKLDDTKIIAPMDGTVVHIGTEVGQYAQAGVPIVKMLGMSLLQIEANIPETDIADVMIDDPVEITFDALSSKELFDGKVVKIDPDATVIQGVIYYKITIELEEDDKRIRTGMTANLDIITERLENVLRIPIRAVTSEEGKDFVELKKADTTELHEVELGLKGESFYEIMSGLQEGDEVVTFTREK